MPCRRVQLYWSNAAVFPNESIGQSILIPPCGMTPEKKVLFRDSLHMILGRTILAMFTQIILTRMFYAEYFENLRS